MGKGKRTLSAQDGNDGHPPPETSAESPGGAKPSSKRKGCEKMESPSKRGGVAVELLASRQALGSPRDMERRWNAVEEWMAHFSET